ncbi:MAG: hypothetical protein ACOYYS_12890 [Chloroflexota bacterium]
MAGILDQLPNPSQLSDLKKMIAFDPASLGFGDAGAFNISDLTASLSSLGGEDALKGLSLPAVPASLSKDGVLSALNQPLGKLKSFDIQAVLGDLAGGSLPIDLAAPNFDLNAPISTITTQLWPGPVTIAAPSFDTNIPGLDLSAAVAPLNRLARAGAATPLRLLFMLMRVGESFVTTITDTDTLFKLTVEALEEIYGQQMNAALLRLPYQAVDHSMRQLGAVDAPQGFVARYRALLNEIETLTPADSGRLAGILDQGYHTFVPALQDFEQARLTLEALSANDTQWLGLALGNVLDLSAADAVFLQKYFDRFGDQAHKILGTIARPVKQIGSMAGKVSDYMNQAADKADTAAQTVATQIETNLTQVEDFLKQAQTAIEDIERQVRDFVETLDVAPLVDKAKLGCAKIGQAVEMFFGKVEELKRKLDEMVQKVGEQIDQKLTEAFTLAEQKIRELLGKITEVLNRPEVKDALEQARQGIEKFKATIEQASLKPVFDLVIGKTGDLENSIKALNVAQLGTPQKAALKVGVKVIEQVKVDEIIKPELLAAFEQIRQPLAELITLLKDKAVEIEKMIYAFNPGTVVDEFIVSSEPYQWLMRLLDDFRPSKLLEPLKQANDFVTGIVRQLDPNLLIDAVQKIYARLAGLVEMLNPAPLDRMIGDAVEVAVSMLGRIRDRELDRILDTIKQTISLARLMEKTGLAEIANADFWQLLQNILGGGYLDEIGKAISAVENQLAALAATLDFSKAQAGLRALVTGVERQIAVDGSFIQKRASELATAFGRQLADLEALEARRLALLQTPEVFPEITALLSQLGLAPVLQLQPAVVAVAEWEAAPMNAAVETANELLGSKIEPLRRLSSASFQDAAVAIFRKQLSEPVNALIRQLQADLQPFGDALKKIRQILITLSELPARIDASVAAVLETARESVKKVITGVINTIQTLQKSLSGVLAGVYQRIEKIVADLSPYWMLNSFAKSDLAGDQGDDTSTPPGMLAIARRIVSGSDDGGLRVAALLQTKLSADQLALLRSEVADTSGALQGGNRKNVLLALNEALRDRNLCARETVDTLKAALDSRLAEIQARPQKAAADVTAAYRCGALRRQLSDAWVRYESGEDKANALIRLNRIVLEAAYPEDVAMSLQSLHPFIVENVAHLYPQDTVDKLDGIYTKTVEKVKALPRQLIADPLDDEFAEIKAILKANFDISGIFAVLEIKVDGLDEDLSQGLDRLSLAYNRLLQAFDQKLSAA